MGVLQPPCLTKSKDIKAKEFIPSLKVFLTEKIEEEFVKMEGDSKCKKVDSISAWPYCSLALIPILVKNLHDLPPPLHWCHQYAYTLLSVKGWRDKKSKVYLLMEKLTIKDKDAMKALNLITSWTRESNKGIVSKRGLIQFFTTGYAALDMNINWVNWVVSWSSCSSPESKQLYL
jgi:hypothetical protein